MSLLRELVLYLRYRAAENDGCLYVKSRDIASEMDYTTRQIGARIAYISRCEDIPLSVEAWSMTSGARTWFVSIEDPDALRTCLATTLHGPEPALC